MEPSCCIRHDDEFVIREVGPDEEVSQVVLGTEEACFRNHMEAGRGCRDNDPMAVVHQYQEFAIRHHKRKLGIETNTPLRCDADGATGGAHAHSRLGNCGAQGRSSPFYLGSKCAQETSVDLRHVHLEADRSPQGRRHQRKLVVLGGQDCAETGVGMTSFSRTEGGESRGGSERPILGRSFPKYPHAASPLTGSIYVLCFTYYKTSLDPRIALTARPERKWHGMLTPKRLLVSAIVARRAAGWPWILGPSAGADQIFISLPGPAGTKEIAEVFSGPIVVFDACATSQEETAKL